MIGDISRNTSNHANSGRCYYKHKDQFWLYVNVCVICETKLRNMPSILFCFLKVDGKEVHLNTNNIKYFLELSQVGLVEDEPQLWAHSDPVSRNKTTFTDTQVLYKQLFRSVR